MRWVVSYFFFLGVVFMYSVFLVYVFFVMGCVGYGLCG